MQPRCCRQHPENTCAPSLQGGPGEEESKAGSASAKGARAARLLYKQQGPPLTPQKGLESRVLLPHPPQLCAAQGVRTVPKKLEEPGLPLLAEIFKDLQAGQSVTCPANTACLANHRSPLQHLASAEDRDLSKEPPASATSIPGIWGEHMKHGAGWRTERTGLL